MLRRFDCPDCGKFLARSDGTQLETRCPRCQVVVTAVPLELQLTVECTRCSRRHYYERPAVRPRHCVICGSDTLETVTCPTSRPTEALTRVMGDGQ